MRAIQFFDNVFEERFCAFLASDARARLRDRGNFTRSNYEWQEGIRNASAVVLVRDYDPALSALILAQLTKRGMIDHNNYHVMNYAWTRLSYIPWHNDDHRDEAMTIYLNEEWDADWGGLFLYRDGDNQIRGYAPKFNSGLKNTNNVNHATTPVNIDAPEPRFTVQLFSKLSAAKAS